VTTSPDRRPGEIQVRLNGKDRIIAQSLSVRGLLESLGLKPELVVVELNREILRRETLGDVFVREGDTLEVVHFVGGG
jgi:thiamine biosynthesis protein ThiS